ncbi:MAG: class I SAM-dependent rRNA methyltransferase [Mediterranea sp.]|jgi:23S rRNA (cytosine1962-C5)-methyltransferase|nr:class I SAM-dependent rRNA methyltransferase [Mediterranea sp.]
MSYPKVFLKEGKEESLKRFHPWIFSGAIESADALNDGDVVEVYTSEKKFIAEGHYQTGSIAIRVLSFKQEPIDRDFWEQRLNNAFDVRDTLGMIAGIKGDIYRFVHGEGDNLPGLIIDIYGKTAVIQAHSVGMHLCRMEIAEVLAEIMEEDIENIYYKSVNTLADSEGTQVESEDDVVLSSLPLSESGFLKGKATKLIANEDNFKFHIDFLKGQKTGFFIDQRESRILLEEYAFSRSVLNLFCYSGGFSVHALRGGAELVHSVDSSARAIELTNSNVALNYPRGASHVAYVEDAFKYLDRMDEPYDLIILDPPAFAKHRSALENARKGYRRLNAKAIEKITRGGIIFTFSCSQVVSRDDFRTIVFSAAASVGRKVRILNQLTQPADHPVNIFHPEGEYLKGLVLYVE